MLGPDAVEAEVLLLDLHLPDGNGLELVASLRRSGLRPVVLAVTGALRACVADSLLKPFTASVLESELGIDRAAVPRAPRG